VAFDDSVRNDDFYEIGEGMANLTVTATRVFDGMVFTTTTTASGGYSMELPAATYDVTVSGPGLTQPISQTGVVLVNQNVKADFTPATPPALPDLTASFRARSPLMLKPGAMPKVPLHITNSGTAAANGTVDVSLYLSLDGTVESGVLVNTVPVALALAPSKSRDISLPISAPADLAAGKYKLIAVVDSGAAVAEKREDNNTAVAAGTTQVVPPFTNLTATIGGQVKAKLPAGSTVNFTLKLKNKGNVLAEGTVTPVFSLVSLTSPGTVVPLSAVPDIGVTIKPTATLATKFSLVLPADLAAGSYRLAVTINSTLSTAESTTADNSATSAFKFTVPTIT
jgi:subtilase family serine protease